MTQTSKTRVIILVTVLGALTAIACSSGGGGSSTSSTSTSTPAVATSTPPSPSPKSVIMPNLVGQNAAVAEDQLKRLGFTNVQLGAADGHAFVALPANWTVKTQSAKAGAQVMSDTLIVLGCLKNT